MTVELRRIPDDGTPLAGRLSAPGADRIEVYWLGQAGFILRTPGTTVLIDPYLSDSLADKYRGTLFDHVRLVPAPISVDDLPPVDAVLCTHGHSDHLDPDTLPGLARMHPDATFVVPAPLAELATNRGAPPARTRLARVGAVLDVAPRLRVRPVPAAHESLEYDAAGDSRHLGYLIELGGMRLYHSGDCVPFDGLADTLAGANVDMALLPVNGRDPYRLHNGVPGNFHWSEAVSLCAAAGIAYLVPHHFGMFAFNTVDPDQLDVAWAAERGVAVTVPRMSQGLVLRHAEEVSG